MAFRAPPLVQPQQQPPLMQAQPAIINPMQQQQAAPMPGMIADQQPLQAQPVMFHTDKSAKADHTQKNIAQQLLAKGVPRDQIWQETGWFKDQNGDWKWEADDSAARVRPEALTWNQRPGHADKYMRADYFLDHPQLRGHYTTKSGKDFMDVTGVQIVGHDHPAFQTGKDGKMVFGRYNSRTNRIQLNPRLTPEQMRETVLHELQHAFQYRRGEDDDYFATAESRAATKEARAWLKHPKVKAFKKIMHSDAYSRANNAMIDIMETPKNKAWFKARRERYENQGLDYNAAYHRAWEDAGRSLAKQRPDKYGVIGEYIAAQQAMPLRPDQYLQDEWKTYKRKISEVEARLTGTRRNFNEQERRARPPWESLDVREDEIIPEGRAPNQGFAPGQGYKDVGDIGAKAPYDPNAPWNRN